MSCVLEGLYIVLVAPTAQVCSRLTYTVSLSPGIKINGFINPPLLAALQAIFHSDGCSPVFSSNRRLTDNRMMEPLACRPSQADGSARHSAALLYTLIGTRPVIESHLALVSVQWTVHVHCHVISFLVVSFVSTHYLQPCLGKMHVCSLSGGVYTSIQTFRRTLRRSEEVHIQLYRIIV